MSTEAHTPKYSFEFFPPRTPDAEKTLAETQHRLAALGPDYFSVTFGAGGSTRDRTLETCIKVREATHINVAPHISCIGYSLEEIRHDLAAYREQGFRHIVALRGDMPSGSLGQGPFRHASELVEFIRSETGDYFYIDVACYPEFHPQAPDARVDLENFKRKVDAGADSAITQYFYNPYAYFYFLDSCARIGIDIPVVPGVMPITNREQLVRFSRVCGAEIPLWILKRLEAYGDDLESIRQFGIDVTTELCAALLAGGAPGLHVYSMNRAAASEAIWRRLDLPAPGTAVPVP